MVPSNYACEIKDVYSGDDLVVMVDLGYENLWQKRRIRLHGVDTPNAVNEGDDTEAGKIRRFVRSICRGRQGQLTIISKGVNSWVVDLTIQTPDGPLNLNTLLADQGYKFKR